MLTGERRKRALPAWREACGGGAELLAGIPETAGLVGWVAIVHGADNLIMGLWQAVSGNETMSCTEFGIYCILADGCGVENDTAVSWAGYGDAGLSCIFTLGASGLFRAPAVAAQQLGGRGGGAAVAAAVEREVAVAAVQAAPAAAEVMIQQERMRGQNGPGPANGNGNRSP
jgi:hypothetical protein